MPLKGLPIFLWITLLITLLRCCKTLENKGVHCVAFKTGSFQNPYESTAYSCCVRYRADNNPPDPFCAVQQEICA